MAVVLLLGMAAATMFSGEALASGVMAAPRLSSDAPGVLTVAWDTPSPAPDDYRLMWAPEGGDWLSYSDPNEAERGNLYPGGGETSLTISGLTPGATYKVMMRARYGPGDSGPWSAEATLRVKPPAAPRLSSGSPGVLTASWDAPSPAPDDYRLMWAPEGGDYLSYSDPNEAERGNLYPDGDETSLTISGLTPGATYKVMMRARYEGKDSGPWTEEATLRVRANPPAAPTELVLAAAHDSVALSWTAPAGSDIAGYRVWRGPDADNLSVLASDTGSTGTTYTDETVSAETGYRYAVAAINTDGDVGAQAGGSVTTPAAPDGEKDGESGSGVGPRNTDNTAPVFNPSTVTRSVDENTAAGEDVGAAVSATDSDADDTLTYSLGGTDAASFDIVSTSGQIQTDADLDYETKTSYSVTVTASDGTASAEAAVTINVTDVDEPPSAPAAPSVSAFPDSLNSLRVSWSAPANTGPERMTYDLQYRQGTSGSWTDGPEGETGTSTIIGGLTADTLYQVQVRATNDEGTSDWSPAGSATTNAEGTEGTLISNTDQPRNAAALSVNVDLAQAFTTGNNGLGYKLTAVGLRFTITDDSVPGITVAIHESNSSGRPGTRLGTLSKTTALDDNSVNRWTSTGIDLDANTTYFVVIDGEGNSVNNDGKVAYTESGSEDPGGAAEWSIADTTLWKAQAHSAWTSLTRSGLVEVLGYAKKNSVCPLGDDGEGCVDFNDEYGRSGGTGPLGVLSPGQPATGRLPAEDRYGDTLRLTGLEAGRKYRIEVDFKGTDAVGGSIVVYHGSPTYQLSWDSNFDGNAVIDLHVLDPRRASLSAYRVNISPRADMRPQATHVGEYTATLTDISDVEYLVGNIDPPLGHSVHSYEWRAAESHRLVGRLPIPHFLPANSQIGQSFTTGSHSAGYLLDRIEAFITMEQSGGNSDARPGIAIYSNTSTKLCDLAPLVDYDTGIDFGKPGLVDKIYAGGCASQTLSANTTYWVVFSEQRTARPYKNYHVVESNTDNEDDSGTSGWTMGNDINRGHVGGTINLVANTKPLALAIFGREK